jgi:hypothetical protein
VSEERKRKSADWLVDAQRGAKFTGEGYTRCQHKATQTIRMPEGFPHYGKIVCLLCARSLGWIPKPETLERRRWNAFQLARLSFAPSLSDWEKKFVQSVAGKKKLSPKQRAIIERLCAEHLEKGGA